MSVGPVGSNSPVSSIDTSPQPKSPPHEVSGAMPVDRVSISAEAKKASGGDVDHDGDQH